MIDASPYTSQLEAESLALMLFRSKFTIAAATACLAGAPPAAAQDTPKGLLCAFERGASQSYAKGRFRSRPAKALKMEIGAIDLDGQRADLVTADGKGSLRIVRALGANHFLEVIAEGYLNITTVYQLDPKRNRYPAVHSRHFGLFGEPLIAQYTGSCTAK
jgi:hypothetical protein